METLVTLTGVGSFQLPKGIDGDEVAVTRLVLPTMYYSIRRCEVVAKLGNYTTTHVFPGGYYPTIKDMMDTLEYILPGNEQQLEFEHDEETMLATIWVKNPRDSIVLPPELVRVLKMPKTLKGMVMSSAPVDIMKQYMLVQADFVERQQFNSTSKPLLYVAHEQNSRQFVKQPLYVPVTRRNLDVINIRVTDEEDRPIEFVTGKPLIQMCFRHKYK